MRYSPTAVGNDDWRSFYKFVKGCGYSSDEATNLADAAFDGGCFEEMCETQQREVDRLHLAWSGRYLDYTYGD